MSVFCFILGALLVDHANSKNGSPQDIYCAKRLVMIYLIKKVLKPFQFVTFKRNKSRNSGHICICVVSFSENLNKLITHEHLEPQDGIACLSLIISKVLIYNWFKFLFKSFKEANFKLYRWCEKDLSLVTSQLTRGHYSDTTRQSDLDLVYDRYTGGN